MAWCPLTAPPRGGAPPQGHVHRKPGEPISHHIQGRNIRHHKHLSRILVITKSPKFSRTRKESETKEEQPIANIRGIFWEERIRLWDRPRARTRTAKCPLSEPAPSLETSHRSQGRQSSGPRITAALSDTAGKPNPATKTKRHTPMATAPVKNAQRTDNRAAAPSEKVIRRSGVMHASHGSGNGMAGIAGSALTRRAGMAPSSSANTGGPATCKPL